MPKFRITAAWDVEADTTATAAPQLLKQLFAGAGRFDVAEVTPQTSDQSAQPMIKQVVRSLGEWLSTASAQLGVVGNKTPQCPVHRTPMRSNKRGWYCPQRVGSSWCDQRAK